MLDQLINETSLRGDVSVAYRGKYRWTKTYVPLGLSMASEDLPRLKEGGLYLVTGGLGGVGLAIADYLAKAVQAKLVLVGRTSFPPRDAWAAWLSEHPANDPTSSRMNRLQQIESHGAEVLVCSADVADPDAMHAVVRRATETFGPIDGVIHAAGVPGGGAIQLKSREAALAVLKPRCAGRGCLPRFWRIRPPTLSSCVPP